MQLVPLRLSRGGRLRQAVAIGVLMGITGPAAIAQEHSPWFGGAGFGGVHQDRRGNDQLLQNGLYLQAHAGRRLARVFAARLDVLRSSINKRNDDFVFVPCPPLSAECPPTFLGPIRLLGVVAGLEASWVDRHILLTTSIGPGGYWLTPRPPGARQFSMGVRWTAGGGYAIARHVFVTTGLEYHRLFTDDGSPRWMLPLVVGIEVRGVP